MISDNLRWLQHLPTGWHMLYRELVSALVEIDPAIEVTEAKQKLGWLRIYLGKTEPRAEMLVRAAESQSRTVCEVCSEGAELRIDQTGWHRTLCNQHGAGFRPAAIGRRVSVPIADMPKDLSLGGALLPWPLFTLDFEASGLGEFTYPIEIGIARWMGTEEPITSWSVLIKPTQAWLRHRVWMPESEKIHGITLAELAQGVSPRWALEHANALLGNHPVFCDGGEHDVRWLRHLAQAAQVRSSFQLADLNTIVEQLSPDQRLRMAQWKSQAPVRHRAGDDAMRHLQALAVAISRQEDEA